jgi:16S rRNA (uracil1498-N3)-methyltransferase
MARRRFIADEISGNRAALTGDHADHLLRVLRARVGQEFEIVAGNRVQQGKISSIENDRVEFELNEEIPTAAATARLTLLLSIFRFDRMEWAIEKCTELGIAEIVPLIARRTDSHLAAASAKRIDRWRRIVRQAAEQSRRSSPPEISAPVKISEALNFPGSLRILLSETETETILLDVLKSQPAINQVALAIGPEGGWTEDEQLSFRNAGWTPASLGNTILRVETAAIAATAIVASAINSL